MMFHIVEFSQNSGGGLGIVREEWLTPRKKEAFWPPYKVADKFNKCLLSSKAPNDDWKLCEIKKMFYTTDSILKARQKLREAESDSEIVTDDDAKHTRKRKPPRKLYSSEDENEEYVQETTTSKLKLLPDPPNPPPPEDNLMTQENTSSPQRRNESPVLFTGCRTPTTAARPIQSSPEVFNLARILSRIESRMDEIQQTQKEILEKLNPSAKLPNLDLPDIINLPCSSPEEVNILEDWLTSEQENKNLLVTKLAVLGGKKVSNVVRKLLQTMFTNNVALLYNWTGKNNKRSLKDLTAIKLIPEIVRKNRHTLNATDDEVNTVIAQWFRFTKDRDGGRENRRK